MLMPWNVGSVTGITKTRGLSIPEPCIKVELIPEGSRKKIQIEIYFTYFTNSNNEKPSTI